MPTYKDQKTGVKRHLKIRLPCTFRVPEKKETRKPFAMCS